MDIKEIAEQVSKRIYVEDGLLLSKFISEKFAEALIESYKAELLKEAGGPVARTVDRDWISTGEGTWLGRIESHLPLDELKSLYTSDQVAAAVAKATNPLEGVAKPAGYFQVEFYGGNPMHQQVGSQYQAEPGVFPLYTAEAVTVAVNQFKEQLAKAEQLWQVAQGRCDGLEEKLAKAEQRVAEAIWKALTEGETYEDILAGEWRKFVKEV